MEMKRNVGREKGEEKGSRSRRSIRLTSVGVKIDMMEALATCEGWLMESQRAERGKMRRRWKSGRSASAVVNGKKRRARSSSSSRFEEDGFALLSYLPAEAPRERPTTWTGGRLRAVWGPKADD